MRRRMVALIAIVTMLLLTGGVGVIAGDDVSEDEDSFVHECAKTPPSDFAAPDAGNETIGWVDGYWYDQPVKINTSDGISQAELDNLSARTAARVEALRCLPFKEVPPVEIIDRDTFSAETEAEFASVGDEARLVDNAQLETMLLVGSDQDSIDVRAQDRVGMVAGYYNFVDNRTVVIADDPETLSIDEEILAHELGHALQDQHFDLSQFQRHTKDMNAGKLGMIEGDVHRIEQTYLNHCAEEDWAEPCVTQDQDVGGNAEPANWGLYFANYQPYSDGPTFVETRYAEGEWDAVNAVYEEMPVTSQQIIYPKFYENHTPQAIFVSDSSADNWERIDGDLSQGYNVIGQAGMSAMFIGPAYDDGNPATGPVVTQDEFLNIDPDDPAVVDASNPINYDLPQTEGWVADRLYTYTDGEAAGTVWKTAWDDASQMQTFKDGYSQLLDYHGGERSEEYEYTWTFGIQSAFDMAVTLEAADDRLYIVTAPTVDDLESIHADISLEPIDDDDSGIDIPPPDTGGMTDDSSDEYADTVNDDSDDDIIPGFGPVAGILSIIAAVAFYRYGLQRQA